MFLPPESQTPKSFFGISYSGVTDSRAKLKVLQLQYVVTELNKLAIGVFYIYG